MHWIEGKGARHSHAQPPGIFVIAFKSQPRRGDATMRRAWNPAFPLRFQETVNSGDGFAKYPQGI
jgi:hypothetical protein